MGGRTHMLLRVELPEGPFIADVGFGGLLGAPIRLEPDIVQTTPWETLKLTRHDGPASEGDLMLWARFEGEWVTAYLLSFEPQLPADYVLSNWFTSTNPEMIFTGNLRLDRLTSEGRLSLFNTKLTERPIGGPASHRMLETAAELDRVIAEDYGIDAPAPAEIYFDRLPRG
jgi:N-hydroxyarylamine O-acetyltransferase